MDVYKPDLGFDNAVEELEFRSQSIGVSTWRCSDMVPKQGPETGKVQDDEDENEDEYVVVEWIARGSGYFSQTFELENYPRNTQLLKIVISSLDQGSSSTTITATRYRVLFVRTIFSIKISPWRITKKSYP